LIKYPETYIAETNQKQPQQPQQTNKQQATSNNQSTANSNLQQQDAILRFHLFGEELQSQYFDECQGASIRQTRQGHGIRQGFHTWAWNGDRYNDVLRPTYEAQVFEGVLRVVAYRNRKAQY
jgi:hypothetical protein